MLLNPCRCCGDVDGHPCPTPCCARDYFFTTKQQLLSDARGKAFLETARVAVHSHPCNSSAAAAAAAPPQPLSYWYGTSLATVRDVAATGKLCVMSLDVQGAEVRIDERSCSCSWHYGS